MSTPPATKRRRVWPVAAALAAVTVVAAGGFTTYRVMNDDGQLARDGREVHGVVAPISGPPTQQWSVSPSDLMGPECETSPATGDSPCGVHAYDVGPNAPLLGIATISTFPDGELSRTSHTLAIDRSTGKRLWRSSETWDDIQCAGDSAGQALCAFTRDGQVSTAWLDVATGVLGDAVRTQTQGTAAVQVLGADGYLLLLEADGDETASPVSLRKIDPAGAVVWTWSASASESISFLSLYRWDGQLYLAYTAVDGLPVVIDDRTGTAAAAPGTQDLPAGTIDGLHRGEPIVRDKNRAIRIGGHQIGAPREFVEPLQLDDGQDGVPLLTGQGSIWMSDKAVLTAHDPSQPERTLWSKPNADSPMWCGGTLVIRVRHSAPDASEADQDFRWTAVDPETGAVRWEGDPTRGTVLAGSYCDGTTLVTANADRLEAAADPDRLEARELATGRVLWTTPSSGDSFGGYLFGARPDQPRILVTGERISSLTW